MAHSPQATEDTLKIFGLEKVGLSGSFTSESEKYWKIVNEAISNLNPSNMRIYCESFTTDMDLEILAAWLSGSDERLPEWKILRELVKKGASLEKTEDISLWQEMYQKFQEFRGHYEKIKQESELAGEKEAITDEDLEMIEEMAQLYDDIAEVNFRRDLYIARRISETLQEREIGILFMGGAHDVISKLPQDIQVELLDERLREFDEFFDEARRGLSAEGFYNHLKKSVESEG